MSDQENKPTIGHNSEIDPAAKSRILICIERVERLTTEKEALNEDIKEVYSEAKSCGLDVKTIRKLVRLRKKSSEALQEEQALLAVYANAIGMQLALFE